MQTRIGIMGGTFNPVHLGHLIMAQDALERMELAKVIFVPASVPPHKIGSPLAPAEHRVAMLRLAVENDPRFEVCEEEIKRGGVSYTIDTVKRLKQLNPGTKLYFIIGSDTLRELHTWKDIYDVMDMCTFVTIARQGYAMESLTAARLELKDPWPARLSHNVVKAHAVDISSTNIRNATEQGRSIRYLVPEAVERYIRDTKLYQPQEISR